MQASTWYSARVKIWRAVCAWMGRLWHRVRFGRNAAYREAWQLAHDPVFRDEQREAMRAEGPYRTPAEPAPASQKDVWEAWNQDWTGGFREHRDDDLPDIPPALPVPGPGRDRIG